MKIKANVASSLIAIGVLGASPAVTQGMDGAGGTMARGTQGTWSGWSSNSFFNYEEPGIGNVSERSEFSAFENKRMGARSSMPAGVSSDSGAYGRQPSHASEGPWSDGSLGIFLTAD